MPVGGMKQSEHIGFIGGRVSHQGLIRSTRKSTGGPLNLAVKQIKDID